MSFLGGALHAVGGAFGDLFRGSDSLMGGYVKDFKDWFDGTAAMRKQNQMMIDNWNMQNAYNTPLAQMQRFKEAGLNPNLIYGQTNMAGSIGTPTAPRSGGESLGRLVSTIMAFYQIGNMIAQNKNLHTQNSLIKSQADFTGAQAERYRYETQWLKDHNTTSFEPGSVRAGKSLASDYADSLGSWVGSKVGQAMSTPTVYTIKARDFDSEDEIKDVFRELSKQGNVVEVDWSGWNSEHPYSRRREGYSLTY